MNLALLLLPAIALSAPAIKPKMKAPAPARRVAQKVSGGKEICALMESFAKAGVPAQKEIDFSAGKNTVVPGKVGAIGRNTGTFTLGNLYFRGLATGEEGYVYRGRCLQIDFPDLDKDGVKDLEIAVTIDRVDPKANPPLQATTAYKRAFIYHPGLKMYQPMDGSANPVVELVIR